MAVALAIFGATFAAFCVWLTVRIVNRREKWAKRTAVGLALSAVLYVLSFGPACWITSRTHAGASKIRIVYRPMTWVSLSSNRLAETLSWYAGNCAADGWH